MHLREHDARIERKDQHRRACGQHGLRRHRAGRMRALQRIMGCRSILPASKPECIPCSVQPASDPPVGRFQDNHMEQSPVGRHHRTVCSRINPSLDRRKSRTVLQAVIEGRGYRPSIFSITVLVVMQLNYEHSHIMLKIAHYIPM